VCHNRPVRQDYLDEIVWKEVLRLLEDPDLIRNEIERRLKERLIRRCRVPVGHISMVRKGGTF